MMKELTASFNSLLQDKRVRAEQSKYEAIQRQRNSAVNRFKRVYQEFLDLESGLQSAKNWYSEMKETVESLEKNVETFVNNRRSEGGQLLNQIEQERAASQSSQAEMERERLRGLMERMAVDPNKSSPPPNPGPSRGTPAPLGANAARYPQTNFAGHYQVPNSPPPNQTNYPGFSSPPNSTYAPAPQQTYTPNPQQSGQQYGQQATYNPSNWGRNPGPVSPPATQTSFGYGVSGRGPASPPPNQTSFSPNQYSTYGNPQGQQFAPPGFVPPPPPPGPPPLGPQQTIHYRQPQQEYQYAGPQGAVPNGAVPRPPQQQQQPQDPWAGLNAWK